ncbi:S-layer homology domain-containing protein [Candidatus Peregrinibacteria bacterium]|jgi:hypothetical protein|nr:S-layer homology domain-containing protein [Candidatus Peregrinibacteria bacterium]
MKKFLSLLSNFKASLVVFGLSLAVFTLFVTLLVPQVSAFTDYYNQYANTEIVYEGELCADVDQNALRGGTFYECANGLSCDIFEQHSGHVTEPYGRCVKDEKAMCEITGGVLYEDMTCNCPMRANGGCKEDVIKVTHDAKYDEFRDELVVRITAENTSAVPLMWSEYRGGCGSSTKDIFGVRLRLVDAPYVHSPIANPQDLYVVGDPWTFHEFSENEQYTGDAGFTCQAWVKNTFQFNPYEVKEATMVIPGYTFDSIGYIVETKYGGTFEYVSPEEEIYLLKCSDGKVVRNGRCVEVDTAKARDAKRDAQIKLNSRTVVPNTLFDISGHWGQLYIEDLLDKGVIDGYRNRMFYPNRFINRAEFTKMLVKAVDYDLENRRAGEHYFNDVYRSDWFAEYVYTAAREGVVEGYTTGHFRPNKHITRSEAVAAAMRAAELQPYTYAHTFFYDVHETWQKPYVESAYRLNLINGKGGGRFDPEGFLTRAEAAKIVSNILNLAPSNVPQLKPYITESIITWPR